MIDRRMFVAGLGYAGGTFAMPGALSAIVGGAQMNTRPIPVSGEALPVVGLGTWQSFDVGENSEARAGLEKVLSALIGRGGSVVDTSPMYGSSETVLGDLVARSGTRKALFLASKVWTSGADQGTAQMQASLAKLRVETLDLMQIHNLVDWKTHLATLRRWQDEGRIRYLGVTHYRSSAYDDLARIIESEPIDFMQVNYSMAEPEAARKLLPLAADNGVAVIINRPFAGGQLFPRVRDTALPDWATGFDCTSWAQFFLKFVLAHPAVTCVIPGTRRAHYMLDNALAGTGRLPDTTTQARMLEYLRSL